METLKELAEYLEDLKAPRKEAYSYNGYKDGKRRHEFDRLDSALDMATAMYCNILEDNGQEVPEQLDYCVQQTFTITIADSTIRVIIE